MMTTGRNFFEYVTSIKWSHNIVGRGWVHRFRVDKMARSICTRLKTPTTYWFQGHKLGTSTYRDSYKAEVRCSRRLC